VLRPPAGLGHAEESLLLSQSSWTERVWREFRAGNLTRTFRDVLLTLHSYRGCTGIWPSHETLASRAKCSVRSVQRALQAGRTLGLVGWVERRVRAAWRWLKASNRYVLALPEGAAEPGLRCVSSTTGQNVRGGESKEKKEAREMRAAALTELLRAAAKAPDLLAARREALAARWREARA
jgi:hypothetical protein